MHVIFALQLNIFFPVSWEILRHTVLHVKIYLQHNVPTYILLLVFFQVS